MSMERVGEILSVPAVGPEDLAPCPHCGRPGRVVAVPYRGGQRQVVVGGATHCRCRDVAEGEALDAAIRARSAERRREELEAIFWRLSRMGPEFRRITLADVEARPGLEPALREARRLAESRPGARGLALVGRAGAGKTLLAVAILQAARARGELTLVAKVPDLLDEVRRAYDDPDAPPEQWYLDRLLEADWVLLDDISGATRWGAEKLFVVVDGLWNYRSRLTVIVTSNLEPPDLARQLGPRGDAILSRLADLCGPWVPVRAGDRRLERAGRDRA